MDSFRSSSNNFRAAPLMIGGVLSSPNGVRVVEAFHPGTGKTLRVQEPLRSYYGIDLNNGTQSRMVADGAELNPDLMPGAGGRKFRAYNKATGAMLWETELPAGTTGAPASYMFEGKQYIVVAVGSKEAGSAQFVALSLP